MLTIDHAAFLDNRAHGDDSIDIVDIDGYVCAVVADGMTMSDYGSLASAFAIKTVTSVFKSWHKSEDGFEYFAQELCNALERGLSEARNGRAETTLSVVIVEPGDSDITIAGKKSVTAWYFALGDSPIIVCRPQRLASGLSELSFLSYQIHDRPIVVEEEGKLYSFLDASSGRICGVPSIGSFWLYEDDICLVMTDGIPFFLHIVRDVGEGSNSGFGLLNKVARKGAKAGEKWFKKFVDKEGLSDDASMAILKCVHTTERVEGENSIGVAS